jgi:hypothetical protein
MMIEADSSVRHELVSEVLCLFFPSFSLIQSTENTNIVNEYNQYCDDVGVMRHSLRAQTTAA